MGYINDMTSIILSEIDFINHLIKCSEDKAYGYWYAARARSEIEQLEKDFDYYLDVTRIKDKSLNDSYAATVYNTLMDRINKIKTQDLWTL